MKNYTSYLIMMLLTIASGCTIKSAEVSHKSAAKILGDPEYLAMSYGGYRAKSREVVPTVAQLKEDMRILEAMGVKLIRTYNTQQFAQAKNLLQAIKELKDANPDFEMYVMLGAWIDCKGAWSDKRDHSKGSLENNQAEIDAAVALAQQYPQIVKIIAVGNEAMITWAENYYVIPEVILKWVNHLQALKADGTIPDDIWITSSDNYESWGGGDSSYRTESLAQLIMSVDFISLHTYPFHETHYHPDFWAVPVADREASKLAKIDAAMLRAMDKAKAQYQGVVDYLNDLGVNKPIHIGETGWASVSSTFYGASGSRAADEYKQKRFLQHMRDWTRSLGMACFYFEGFDEKWKDQNNETGSENHFGLVKLNGEAKYAIWDLVDQGAFDGLTRDGQAITKTFGGDETILFSSMFAPLPIDEIGQKSIKSTNDKRTIGERVSEEKYVILDASLESSNMDNMTYPSDILMLNPWEGTCNIELKNEIISVHGGTGDWWGCSLQVPGHQGENLSKFGKGKLIVEAKGPSDSSFKIGFQSGIFAQGTQINNYVEFGPNQKYNLEDQWISFTISLDDIITEKSNLSDVTALLFLRGETSIRGKTIQIRKIRYLAN